MRMNVQFDASLAAIECNSTPLMRISGFGFTFVMGTLRIGKSIDTSYAPSMATGTKLPISSNHAARANLVDAKKAAEMLGISIASLYSYVSRGKLGRTEDPKTGTSLFGVQEIKEFKSRRDRGKRPDQVAIASLDFGLPVLESGISTVEDGRLLFRGHDAAELASHVDLETVAALLWVLPTPRLETGVLADVPPGPFKAAFSGWLAQEAAACPSRTSWATSDVLQHASRIFQVAAAIGTGSGDGNIAVHQRLVTRYGVDQGYVDLLKAAFVLHADHELNTSTFAVRCVASTYANPYAAVLAGFCATTGSRHADFRAALESIQRFSKADHRVAPQDGAAIVGFGHPLYPQGDPRARTLLDALASRPDLAGRMAVVDDLIAQVGKETGRLPKNDFAMAALVHALALPVEVAEIVFTTSRLVGWMAHALEQYALPTLIRPRARFRLVTGHGARAPEAGRP
jgi:citrate synthase